MSGGPGVPAEAGGGPEARPAARYGCQAEGARSAPPRRRQSAPAAPEAAAGARLQLLPARLVPLTAEEEAKAVALLAELIGDRLAGSAGRTRA